jgi:hypothetical protein
LYSQKSDLPYESQWPLDEWKLNKDDSAVRLVLNLQKAAENNDFNSIKKVISDSINITGPDGSRIQGIDAFEENFRPLFETASIIIRPQGWLSFKTKEKNDFVLLWTQEEIIDDQGNLNYYNAHEGFYIVNGKIQRVNQWHRPRTNPPLYISRVNKIVDHLSDEFSLNPHIKNYLQDLYMKNFLKTSPLVKKAKDNGEDQRKFWELHSKSIKAELINTFGEQNAKKMLNSVNDFRKNNFNDKV